MALLIGFAASGPADGSAVYDPPGPLLTAVKDVLGDVVLWSGFAAGAALASVVAVGLAAVQPGTRRLRVSWWVVGTGAWASVVFFPDWLASALQPPLREPALLVAAGLPSAFLVSWHAITRKHAG